MRDYIFHGKCKDTGEWVEGYYACESNHACFQGELKHRHFIFRDEFMDWNLGGLVSYEVISESVGQYTGMNEFVVTDRSYNRPLFEGDIVEIWGWRSPMSTYDAQSQYDGHIKIRAVIKFDHAQWKLDYKNKYNEALAKLKGKEVDKRSIECDWELHRYGSRNEEFDRERNVGYKLRDIVKIGTVFENADLLEG